MAEHEMKYRSGFSGFGQLNGPPTWYCTCGGWTMVRTGASRRPGEQSFALHVKSARG